MISPSFHSGLRRLAPQNGRESNQCFAASYKKPLKNHFIVMDERKSFLVKHFGLRGIALLEAGKGGVALLAGFAILIFRHKDYQAIAERVLAFLHISPGRRFFQTVVRGASHMTTHTIWLVFFGIIVYVLIRFVEATGLWLEREWAEWFALLSGSMYLPWEIYELVRHVTWVKWTVLSINLLIVIYLLWLRIEMHKVRKRAKLRAPANAAPGSGNLEPNHG